MYALFPILAAAIYGLGYVWLEKAVGKFNVTTYIIIHGLLYLVTASVLYAVRSQTITAELTSIEWKYYIFAVLSAVCIIGGMLLTTYGIKNVSATYAAMGEISYPVFVPVFAYLLFREKNWDLTTLIGGAVTLLGVYILIYGKTHLPKI